MRKKTFLIGKGALCFQFYIWPASCEKGHSAITDSVDPDQPLHDIENSCTQSNLCTQHKKYMCH